jgi:hypothetical protein
MGSRPNVSVYVNTADPGDVSNGILVPAWPSSGLAPYGYGNCTKTTVTTNTGPVLAGENSPACAWVFGAEAGNVDLALLRSAAMSAGISGTPSTYPWWLDVETSDVWRSGSAGQAMNVAVVQGLWAALRAGGVTTLGVYSTSYQWGVITGGTDAKTPAIGGLPVWIPVGHKTFGDAAAACASASFTGGPVEMTQWTTTIDQDVRCGSVVTVSSPTPLPSRLYGSDAVGTAIAISEAEFPAPGSAKAVVLARSDFFSDALAGGPLAAKLGGPLLITPGASKGADLDRRVLSEIERVLPAGGTVFVLGGTLALGGNIDGSLAAAGYGAMRIFGQDEFGTAVAVAQVLGNPSTIFEATGLTFYDALSAVPAAVEKGGAILLTNGNRQAPETAAYLAQHPGDTLYAVGGRLAAFGADPSAIPIYGATLYDTSAVVASTFFAGATMYGAATATNFPDALGGGVYMATGGRLGPLLLVDPGSLTLWGSISSYLGTLAVTTPGTAFGGPLAVPSPVLAALQAAVG